MQNLQSVSTLMDGEQDGDEAAQEIARIKTNTADVSSRDGWDVYHLIGDVIRDDAAGVPVLSSGFSARFSERLAQEPTVLAPRTARFTRKLQTYALSAAASVAAITVVGWMAFSTTGSIKPDAPAELAQAPVVQPKPLVAVLQAPLVRSQPQLDKAGEASLENMHVYMLAHQGLSPSTSIQGVTPYIRTVSSNGE